MVIKPLSKHTQNYATSRAKPLNRQSLSHKAQRKMKKTAKCKYCGEDVVLPFTCNYCGGSFCGEHRLPERHACPEAWKARAPRDIPPPKSWSSDEPSYKYTISYTPQAARKFGFSIKELQHLTVGALLVMGVGLSYFILRQPPILDLVALSIAFTLSFLLHELAHKFSAQHFNLWAEFRLTLQGALLTLISMFLPFFKIISPGAVMIAGSGTKEMVGKTAIAGPTTNIIISTVCILIAVASQQSLFMIVAFINALMAVFNLVPFGILDGWKVFRWNKTFWALAFTAAAALLVYTYLPASSAF